MLPKPEVTPRRGQSRDGPERDGPFGPGRGTEPGGGVDCGWGAGRVGWCAGAPALSRGGARRSAREARHEVAKGRIRAVAVRQDRTTIGGLVDRRPRDAGGRVVPGEPELVAAVVLVRHQVDELQRVEGEEAVGDTDGDDDPVVGAELACLHDRAIARSVQEGP